MSRSIRDIQIGSSTQAELKVSHHGTLLGARFGIQSTFMCHIGWYRSHLRLVNASVNREGRW